MHKAYVVTDLTFGDAGKGSIVDALVRQKNARLVVRYNGGAQAAHTVLDRLGRKHTFHQFGSGSLVEGTQTFLSRFVMVNPILMHYEAEALSAIGVSNPMSRLAVDGRAVVTTPYHIIVNKIRELFRGDRKHGSCGLGIGETMCDSIESPQTTIRMSDLLNPGILKQRMHIHRDLKRSQVDDALCAGSVDTNFDTSILTPLLDELNSDNEFEAALEVFGEIADRLSVAGPDYLPTILSKPGCTVFEGAQGVLLDQTYGFHPNTTWSDCTPSNAIELIDEANGDISRCVLGLTRAYATRHGAGPLPTEDELLTNQLSEPDNPTNDWQGAFRAGWLDLSLLRYAIGVCSTIDGLIVTCLDRLKDVNELRVANRYHSENKPWAIPTHFGSTSETEAIGARLAVVKAQYVNIPADCMHYASWVAEQLNVPLLGTSSGPTANSKMFEF